MPTGLPEILCEPAVFYRELAPERRDEASKLGLAAKSWFRAGYADQGTAIGRQSRCERMIDFDEVAAYRSISMASARSWDSTRRTPGTPTQRRCTSCSSTSTPRPAPSLPCSPPSGYWSRCGVGTGPRSRCATGLTPFAYARERPLDAGPPPASPLARRGRGLRATLACASDIEAAIGADLVARGYPAANVAAFPRAIAQKLVDQGVASVDVGAPLKVAAPSKVTEKANGALTGAAFGDFGLTFLQNWEGFAEGQSAGSSESLAQRLIAAGVAVLHVQRAAPHRTLADVRAALKGR